jgi:hypothetical protein
MPNFDMEHLYKYFIGQLKMDQNILQNDYPTKKDLKNLYKKSQKMSINTRKTNFNQQHHSQ